MSCSWLVVNAVWQFLSGKWRLQSRLPSIHTVSFIRQLQEVRQTSRHDILDTFLLAFTLCSFILFTQFWQHQWSDGFKDTWQSWIFWMEQPPGAVCRILQKNAAFEDRVFADAQVAPDRGHGASASLKS